MRGDWLFLICGIGTLIGFLIAGCSDDGRVCVASHEETGIMPMYVGDQTIFIPTTDTVCDRWVSTKETRK